MMESTPNRYRRLTRKIIKRTMTSSPKLPGQMNQPPPLEYPATRQPDDPTVATHAARRVNSFATRLLLENFFRRIVTFVPPKMVEGKQPLDFLNHRSNRVGGNLSCYRTWIRHNGTSVRPLQTRKSRWCIKLLCSTYFVFRAVL
jgi:hypothetical protein